MTNGGGQASPGVTPTEVEGSGREPLTLDPPPPRLRRATPGEGWQGETRNGVRQAGNRNPETGKNGRKAEGRKCLSPLRLAPFDKLRAGRSLRTRQGKRECLSPKIGTCPRKSAKGVQRQTGTPRGSNVKQGPQGGPTANRDPKGVQHHTWRNRKSESSVGFPEL